MPHWTIDVDRGELRDAGNRHVVLRRRSFELLLILARQHDQVVPKDDLIAANWRGLAVTDDSLTKCISEIRRTLGPGLRDTIRTVAGRGYMLTGWAQDAAGRLVYRPSKVQVRGQDSRPAPQLLGRAEEIESIRALLPQHRLVTIAGPGGVGKTSLAQAVADLVAEDFSDGIYFVPLGPLRSADAIAGAIAGALGLAPQSSASGVAAAIEGRRLLLVLDNCEHLVAAIAGATAELLATASGLTVLATSREPLAIHGEQVFRLRTLEYPSHGDAIAAAEALRYPAVQLLCTEAQHAVPGFVLTDVEAPVAAELCRRLDGIPLALVLAAARLGTLSLAEINGSLDRRFDLLSNGPRGAEERQRTLRAMVGWSVDLLDADERQLFAEIGVFAGAAFLEDIVAVCRAGDRPPTLAQVLGLAERSLLNVHRTALDRTRFGYHETTRHYALECLGAQGVRDARRRLVLHLIAVFQQAETAMERQPLAVWRAAYLPYLDDVRAALLWAFSAEGDPQLAAELVGYSAELFEEASQQPERLGWIERALALDTSLTPSVLGRLTYWRMVGDSFGIADPALARSAAAHFAAAGEPFFEGRALASAMIGDAGAGEHDLARETGLRAEALVAPEGDTRGLVDLYRYRAMAELSMGDPEAARAAILRSRAVAERLRDDKGVLWSFDFLAELAFARGDYAETLAIEEASLARAREIGSQVDVLFCSAYAATCRLFMGDVAGALAPLRQAFDVRRRIGSLESRAALVALAALYLSGRGDERGGRLVAFAVSAREPGKRQLPRFEAAVFERLQAWFESQPPAMRTAQVEAVAGWSLGQALDLATAALSDT